jgi:hypothetical protein
VKCAKSVGIRRGNLAVAAAGPGPEALAGTSVFLELGLVKRFLFSVIVSSGGIV